MFRSASLVVAPAVLLVLAALAVSADSRVPATPGQLKATIASAISAEKAALSALGSDPAGARSELESSLSQLRSTPT